MKIAQSYVQKAKTVAHIFQAILIFIAGCIVLAVFTKGDYIGGGPKWFFALVRERLVDDAKRLLSSYTAAFTSRSAYRRI